jgi:DNA-binding transcriptional regulator YhcF (GntR family)
MRRACKLHLAPALSQRAAAAAAAKNAVTVETAYHELEQCHVIRYQLATVDFEVGAHQIPEQDLAYMLP